MAERQIPQDLTEGEKESIRRRDYSTAPIVFNAAEALNSGMIQTRGKSFLLHFNEDQAKRVGSEKIQVGPVNIHDVVALTVYGLDEGTAKAGKATILRDAFLRDLGAVKDYLDKTQDAPVDYGSWVYYPRRKKLVHYANEYWHRTALTLTTGLLFMDPEMMLEHPQIRNILENTTPVVMGLSVGNYGKEALSGNLRSKNMIIGDKRNYKASNGNRVRFDFEEVVLSNAERDVRRKAYKRGEVDEPDLNGMRPKWQVAAEQVHGFDPYVNIFCYPGMDESNFNQVLEGNRIQPKADVMIEVCDTTTDKISAAEAARKAGVMFIRGTDGGATAWVDFYDYRKNPNLPLAYDADDQKMWDLTSHATDSQEDFTRFVNAAVGPGVLEGDNPFTRQFKGLLPQVGTSVPQDRATPMALGALLGYWVPLIALGHEPPARIRLDLVGQKVDIFTES